MNRNKCVIIVPIYKQEFNFDEYNSIKQLFKILPIEKYDIVAVGPISLDRTYYFNNFNFTKQYYFWDSYFIDYPKGYNSLMLNYGFYEYFESYEFMLIYQPDCWVFRDELEYWCNKNYDYIGAPHFVCCEEKNYLNYFSNTSANGGFSLRKISFWRNLCLKYKDVCNKLINDKNVDYGEDRIISTLSFYGINININMPSFYECANFSYETNPHILYLVTNHKLPFGCHAYNKVTHSYFWDDFITYKKKLYSVVTYLFGDYDILKDPDEIDENAEYICLTDRDDLKSNVWQFKKLNYPNINQYNSWQKTLIARYTVLDYISTDICVKIDASVHIKKSINKFILQFNSYSSYNCAYLLHPWRDNYLDEYDEWINTRHLNPIQKEQFLQYCEKNNYDYNSKGMIMTTFMIVKNNETNKQLDKYVLSELMNNFNFNQRIDQIYYSIIFVNKFFNNDNYQYIFYSMQILDSEYLEYFYHGENYTHSGEYKYFTDIPDYKYLNNTQYICNYMI